MGMDVYGKKPTSEAGEYFRNSVWGWRPLWDYCHQIAPEIISTALHKSGHYNDGAGLDAAGSLALALRLQAEIDSGRCAIYANDRQARLDGIPDEDCEWCKGTGVRRDAVGVANGFPAMVIEKPNHPRHGQQGYCNACDSMGHKRPIDTYYSFDVDNVRQFVAFLRDCGGFEIN